MKTWGNKPDLLLLGLAALAPATPGMLPYEHAGSTVGLTAEESDDAIQMLIPRYVEGAVQTYGSDRKMIHATRLTPLGRQTVADMKERQSNRRDRRLACRSAIISWLYEADESESDGAAWSDFDAAFGNGYFGTGFQQMEVEAAAAYLHQQQLIDGFMIEESVAPIMARLTVSGTDCAEQFDCDVNAYVLAQRPAQGQPAVGVADDASRDAAEESAAPASFTGQEIFLVHGHGAGLQHEVARFIQKLTGREPIVLNEQANAGQTVIEKFERHAESAGFAVVLATADDLGRAKGDPIDRPRARQNVVLELGYFFAKLGRGRVSFLHEPGVEIPSDVAGLVYVTLDAAGNWKRELARELVAAQVSIADMSALL